MTVNFSRADFGDAYCIPDGSVYCIYYICKSNIRVDYNGPKVFLKSHVNSCIIKLCFHEIFSL